MLAVDLSGHGDSDHRDRYELGQWPREIMAVADNGGIAGPPVVVGHSMGGAVTVATAAQNPGRLAGAIVCDSPVGALSPDVAAPPARGAIGPHRVYATIDQAVARYRTLPAQEHYLPYVRDHVARRSSRAVAGGWQWKFDPRVFDPSARRERMAAVPSLAEVTCRLALLRSEHGILPTGIGASLCTKSGRVVPVVELPEAGHHAMLDQPLVLLTAIRALLAEWENHTP